MLTKAAAAVATVALVQAPVRFAVDVLILRRVRRVCPDLFDGPAYAAAVAACIDEYQREFDLTPVPSALRAARGFNRKRAIATQTSPGATGVSARDPPGGQSSANPQRVSRPPISRQKQHWRFGVVAPVLLTPPPRTRFHELRAVSTPPGCMVKTSDIGRFQLSRGLVLSRFVLRLRGRSLCDETAHAGSPLSPPSVT